MSILSILDFLSRAVFFCGVIYLGRESIILFSENDPMCSYPLIMAYIIADTFLTEK